jgi:hypothetical protein
MNKHVERALQLMENATRDMSGDDLRYHPAGKWSSADILEHLTLSFVGTCKNIEKTISAGTTPVQQPTFNQRVANFILLELGIFPKGRQSPEFVRPTGSMPNPREQFRANMMAMDGAIARAQQTFGAQKIIAVHPILGPLTAKQWGKFHYVHIRHHMKQIATLRKQLNRSRC